MHSSVKHISPPLLYDKHVLCYKFSRAILYLGALFVLDSLTRNIFINSLPLMAAATATAFPLCTFSLAFFLQASMRSPQKRMGKKSRSKCNSKYNFLNWKLSCFSLHSYRIVMSCALFAWNYFENTFFHHRTLFSIFFCRLGSRLSIPSRENWVKKVIFVDKN